MIGVQSLSTHGFSLLGTTRKKGCMEGFGNLSGTIRCGLRRGPVLVLSISKSTTSFRRKSRKRLLLAKNGDNYISERDLRPYYLKPRDDAPAVRRHATTSEPTQPEGASTPMPDAEDPGDKPVTDAPTHLGVSDDPSAVTDVQSQTDAPNSTAGENLQTDPAANDVPVPTISVPTISYGNQGKQQVRFVVPYSFTHSH